MDKTQAFAEKSMELLLKIKKIENKRLNDSNDMLFDALKERATFHTININRIITTKIEKEAVIALREAYMKINSTRYFIKLLFDTDEINESEADELFDICDALEDNLKPSVELCSGLYDSMPDMECFDEIEKIWEKYFGDYNADNSEFFKESFDNDDDDEELLF